MTTWTVLSGRYHVDPIAILEHEGIPVLIYRAGNTAPVVDETGRRLDERAHLRLWIGSFCRSTKDGSETRYTDWSLTAASATEGASQGRWLDVGRSTTRQEHETPDALIAEAREHFDRALSFVRGMDATYAAASERLAQMTAEERTATFPRVQYEAACRRLSITPRPDSECGDYGVRYGQFTFPEYSADTILDMDLCRARLRGIEAEKTAALKLAASWQSVNVSDEDIAQMREEFWGKKGLRWDESCDFCHEVGVVDNQTGLCKKCGKGKAA